MDPDPPPSSLLTGVSLVGRGGGNVKQLSGFKKSHHTVPDAVNATTSAFFAKLCAAELADEAEQWFQKAKASLSYKRKDLTLDVASPTAVLTARDFIFELAYALEPADPALYSITRTLHSVRNGQLVHLEAFDGLFRGMFTSLQFFLRGGVRVEAVIDAVEALDPPDEPSADEIPGISVEYPSDYRTCTLSVAGVDAQVVCDGATLEIQFPRAGSPRELIEAFFRVRDAFVLTRADVLAGLVGA